MRCYREEGKAHSGDARPGRSKHDHAARAHSQIPGARHEDVSPPQSSTDLAFTCWCGVHVFLLALQKPLVLSVIRTGAQR